MNDLAALVDRLKVDCAEAYQVIGVLAERAGALGNASVTKALDNLSAAAAGRPRPHDDLLPFSVGVEGASTEPNEDKMWLISFTERAWNLAAAGECSPSLGQPVHKMRVIYEHPARWLVNAQEKFDQFLASGGEREYGCQVLILHSALPLKQGTLTFDEIMTLQE